MADETAVLETETLATEDAAPIEETAAEPVNAGETGESDAETPDYEADKARAVEEAVNAARADWEAAQNSERYKRSVTDAVGYRQQAGVEQLRNFAGWIADQMDKGSSKSDVLQAINPRVISSIAAQVEAMAATEQWALIGDNFDAFVKKEYPDWKPSQELAKSFQNALTSQDPQRMFTARWEYQRQALLETEVPKLVAKQLEQERAKNKSAAQVKAKQEGDRARANAPRPTNTNGAALPGRMTLAQIEAMPTAEWLAKPREERNRLLEQARRG